MTSDAWYDEQRRLTPDDLLAVTFPLTRWGRHGLDEDAVRGFLAGAHAEMVRRINERASLWQEDQRQGRRILGQETENEALTVGKDDARNHSGRIRPPGKGTAARDVSAAP